MTAIFNFFRADSNYDAYSLLKKDDDACIKAFESWIAKYTSENIGMDGSEKVEMMLTELLEIPVDGLSIAQKNRIGDTIHTIASKRIKYQNIITERFRNNRVMTIQMWYQRAYDCLPKQR